MNENLLKLIEQTPEIKKRFKTEYISIMKRAGESPKQTPCERIHNDEQYLLWKAEIEEELQTLPESKTVKDIYNLFLKMQNNLLDDSRAFAELEAKLKVLGKRISNSVQEEDRMNKPHKIFISHSSKDREYVEAIVSFFEDLGLKEENIICSSVPPYCIPLNNNIYEWLVNEFQNSNLYVIYILSKNYYNSASSLNEMGATWAMKHEWTGLLLPGFNFNQLDGCIDKGKIGIKLDDSDDKSLKYRLTELKNKIEGDFKLELLSESKWERKRDDFLKKVSSIKEKRTLNCKDKE